MSRHHRSAARQIDRAVGVAVAAILAEGDVFGAGGGGELVVGVRVGATGALGSVGPGAAGPRRRPPGELSLQLVTRGTPTVGDPVTTLGSPDGPFEPGVRVGTVAAVDQAAGALTVSASVTPAVDVGSLDVVGVLPARARTTPRPVVTGGG